MNYYSNSKKQCTKNNALAISLFAMHLVCVYMGFDSINFESKSTRKEGIIKLKKLSQYVKSKTLRNYDADIYAMNKDNLNYSLIADEISSHVLRILDHNLTGLEKLAFDFKKSNNQNDFSNCMKIYSANIDQIVLDNENLDLKKQTPYFYFLYSAFFGLSAYIFYCGNDKIEK